MTSTQRAVSATAADSRTGIRRVVLTGIEHSRLGGVCAFMNTMAHGLLHRGYEVVIIGMQPPPQGLAFDYHPDPRIERMTIYDSIPPGWVRVRRRDRFNPVARARYLAWERAREAAIERLRPIVAGWGPETLVICTQIFAMEHLVPAGLQTGRPHSPYVIAQYHDSRIASVRVGSIARLRTWYAGADRLLALTEVDAHQFQDLDRMNNTGWMLNPLPPLEPRPPVERADEVVTLARYEEQKSLDWLIRAWAVLAPEFPGWRLRMYGEGPLRGELQALIDSLGVAGSAVLEGTTADPEGALRRAKFHALTSQHEGAPLSIAEASRAGTPTVAFDCAPSIRMLIADGEDGLVVPANHLAKLVEAMRTLLRDEALRDRMGTRAEQRSARFDLDTVLDRWEDEMRLLTGCGGGVDARPGSSGQ